MSWSTHDSEEDNLWCNEPEPVETEVCYCTSLSEARSMAGGRADVRVR